MNQQWDEENNWISAINYNRPPVGQPGLWCQQIPTPDGRGIQRDGSEKFYHFIAWLEYLIPHFLAPWGYHLGGEFKWMGEDLSDTGHISCKDNQTMWPVRVDFLKETKVFFQKKIFCCDMRSQVVNLL